MENALAAYSVKPSNRHLPGNARFGHLTPLSRDKMVLSDVTHGQGVQLVMYTRKPTSGAQWSGFCVREYMAVRWRCRPLQLPPCISRSIPSGVATPVKLHSQTFPPKSSTPYGLAPSGYLSTAVVALMRLSLQLHLALSKTFPQG